MKHALQGGSVPDGYYEIFHMQMNNKVKTNK